jgi:hypothetical protein
MPVHIRIPRRTSTNNLSNWDKRNPVCVCNSSITANIRLFQPAENPNRVSFLPLFELTSLNLLSMRNFGLSSAVINAKTVPNFFYRENRHLYLRCNLLQNITISKFSTMLFIAAITIYFNSLKERISGRNDSPGRNSPKDSVRLNPNDDYTYRIRNPLLLSPSFEWKKLRSREGVTPPQSSSQPAARRCSL